MTNSKIAEINQAVIDALKQGRNDEKFFQLGIELGKAILRTLMKSCWMSFLLNLIKQHCSCVSSIQQINCGKLKPTQLLVAS